VCDFKTARPATFYQNAADRFGQGDKTIAASRQLSQHEPGASKRQYLPEIQRIRRLF
jgi:hypothetical protein